MSTPTPIDTALARRHLLALARGDGYYELRTLRRQPDDSMAPGGSHWLAVSNGTPQHLDRALQWASDQHRTGCEIFVGYNPRITATGKGKDDVGAMLACYADLDLHGERIADAQNALLAAPAPPSLIVASGYGLHPIWFIQPTADKERWRQVQRGIAAAFAEWLPDSSVVTDEARVLRLVPFPNGKYNTCSPTAILHQAQTIYTLDQLATAYPAPREAPRRNNGSTAAGNTRVPPGLQRYAEAGIAKGERNKCAFWLACRLVEEVADERTGRAVLAVFGRRCNPALPEAELDTIWDSAHKTTHYDPSKARHAPAPPAGMYQPDPMPPTPDSVPAGPPTGPDPESPADLETAGQYWAACYGAEWAYNEQNGAWYRWAGTHWQEIGQHETALRDQATQVLRAVGLTISTIGRIDGVIARAASGCKRRLDAPPGLVNFANGTLDTRGPGSPQLRPHDRADGLTYVLPYAYAPGNHAVAERFLTEAISDATARQALLTHYGLALLGDTRLHYFLLIIGPPRSGKSTLLQLGNLLCGQPAAGFAGPELFDRQSEGLRSRAIWGARRLVAIDELPVEALRNEELVKSMAAHSGVPARRLREHEQTDNQWRPKLVMCTNEAPHYTDRSGALTGRLIPVRCPNTRPIDARDKYLVDSLIPELPALAASCITAALTVLVDRYATYPISPAMQQDLIEIEQQADPLKSFVAERCILDKDAWEETAHVYEKYTEFCGEGGNKPLSKINMSARLRERYGLTLEVRRLKKENRTARGMAGLRLRTPDDPDPADEATCYASYDVTQDSNYADSRENHSEATIYSMGNETDRNNVTSVTNPAGHCAHCGYVWRAFETPAAGCKCGAIPLAPGEDVLKARRCPVCHRNDADYTAESGTDAPRYVLHRCTTPVGARNGAHAEEVRS